MSSSGSLELYTERQERVQEKKKKEQQRLHLSFGTLHCPSNKAATRGPREGDS